MSLTIYGHPRSRTFRVLWVLEELGLPYDLVEIPAYDAAKDSRVKALNPIGKIPLLQDEGEVLTESMVMGYYLARKAKSPLLPATLIDECRVLQWTSWVQTEVERPLTQVFQHRVLYAAEKRKPDVADAAEAELPRPFDALEQALDTRAWLVDGRFTLADLNVSIVMLMTRYIGKDMSRWPRAVDWLARCTARPAFAAAERLRG